MLNSVYKHCNAPLRAPQGLQSGTLGGSGHLVPGRPRIVVCNAASAPTTDSADETAPSRARRVRRGRLFSSDDSSEGGQPKQPAAAVTQRADAPRQKRAAPEPPTVSEEFKKAFESLGIQTLPAEQPKRREVRREALSDADSDWQDEEEGSRGRRSRSKDDLDSKVDRFREWGRDRSFPSSSKSSGSSSSSKKQKGGAWMGRGKQSDRDEPRFGTRSSSDRRLSPEERRRQWEAEAEERQRELEEQERKRLIRKERSERIPDKPKPKQDPVIFQAITREWDEKTTLEERRGARAAARKISALGLYDRNKTVRKLRQKYVQGKIKDDPEAQKVAKRAVEQVEEAAAKSIQKVKEELYQEAAGVKRSFARAEALAEGEWERLKRESRAMDSIIKIGRKGCTPAVASACHAAWRGREVVKLRIHDDKSARKMNLPRYNVLLRELEEQTGGVLIEASGSSIWMYRGTDWVPPPIVPPYKAPEPAEHFTQEHKPRGKWTDIADISCYVVSSSETADMPSAKVKKYKPVGAVASVAGAAATGGDVMTVLFLPDQFPMKEQPMMMQVADRLASKGVLVVMPDLLGPPAHFKHSALNTNGESTLGPSAGYWPVNRWPVVRKRKLEHMEWFQSGPGSWLQQRPRLLQLLEEMQKQGMYDKDAPDLGAPVAAAAAAAAAKAAEGGSSSNDTADMAAAAAQPEQQAEQQEHGKPLGILGFSWGSHAGLRAAGDEECLAAGLKAVAAMSPMTFQKDVEIARTFQIPVCLLPAKYDPMDQMMLTIDLLQRSYAPRCIFKRFGKVKPGWANWLPQWKDSRAMFQAAEQLLMSVAFLQRELLGKTAGSALLPPPLASTVRTAEEQEAAMKAAAAADADADGEEEAGGESVTGEDSE